MGELLQAMLFAYSSFNSTKTWSSQDTTEYMNSAEN